MITRIKFLIIRCFAKYRVIKYKIFSLNRADGTFSHIQPVQIMGDGRVSIGKNTSIGYFPSPHFFSTYGYLEARHRGSEIKIGANTKINNGFVAIADRTSITIGENCLIGARVEIYDSDFHSLNHRERNTGATHTCARVEIESDVFIGSNVTILKGVTVGQGSVIGNGAVVVKDVPPKSISTGVPARVVGII